MAESKPIKGTDVIQKGFLNDAIKEAKLLEDGFKLILEAQKKLLEQSKKKGVGNAAEIKKTNAALNKSKKAIQGLTAIQKEKLKLEAKLKRGRSTEIDQITELKILNQQQNKANTAFVKNKLGLISAYDKESKKLNELRKRYKDLAVSEGAASKGAKKLLAQITPLDKKLKQIDSTVGQSQRNVGNYGSAFKRVGNTLRTGLGFLGITAGITAITGAISNAIKIFATFEKANSNLKAVLGATGEEMDALSEQAKELGSVTSFTASEVVGLQTSFAKLGFPTKDIQLMTESTLNAAAAMGSGLDETATLTGSTLKAFGLDASEAARVNDVLAKATSASALDFQKLSTSMSTIAPVANSFGFSVEGSTALLGQLANAGFDASSAATATRNILLNLADSNSKLGKSLKEPVTDLPSLVKGLKQLKGEGIDLGTALELTDKRSVAAFSTFLNGTDSVLELNDALLNAGGTAEQMADTQLDNLSGSVTLLNSAWEGFILSLEDGSSSLGKALRFIVDVTTEILSLLSGTQKLTSELDEGEKKVRDTANSFIKFLKILRGVVIGYIAYRGVLIAANIQSTIAAVKTKALAFAQNISTVATKVATVAMRIYNAVIKLNPLGLLITLLAGAVTALLLFGESAETAAEAQKRLNKAAREGAEEGAKIAKINKESANEEIAALDLLFKRKLANAKNDKERLELNKQLAKEKKAILNSEKKDNEDAITSERNKTDALKKELNREIKITDDRIKANQKIIDNTSNPFKAEEFESRNIGQKKRRKEQADELSELIQSTVGVQKVLLEANKQLNKEIEQADIDLLEATKTKTKGLVKLTKDRQKELDLLLRKLQDLQDANIEDDFDRELNQIDRKFKRELEAIKGNSKIEVALRKELKIARDTAFTELDEKFTAIAIAEANKRVALLNDISDVKDQAEIERIEREISKLEATDSKRIDLINKRNEIEKRILERNAKESTDLITDEDKNAAKERDLVAENLAKELAALEGGRLKAVEDVNAKIKAANEKERADELAARQEFLKSIATQTLSELRSELDKVNQVKRDAINKEIKDREDDINRQQALAEKGLDNQLAFEKKKKDDAEIAKREQEQREQREKEALQLSEAFLEAYIAELNKAGANPATAGAKALSATLIAKGIAKTISGSFFDGTEDTGTVNGALDSNGGRLAMLHDNERVVTKDQNSMIGNMSNDNLAQLAYDYRTGNLMTDGQLNKSSTNGVVIDNSGLVMEIKGLRKDIKNKEVQQVRVDQLGNLIETVYSNGIKTVTNHKSKRRI